MGKKFQVATSLGACLKDLFFCPLLFILYIDDFNACTKDLKFIHFADDSTVYAKGNSLSDVAAKINTELHKVVNWFQINKLSLNTLTAAATRTHISPVRQVTCKKLKSLYIMKYY